MLFLPIRLIRRFAQGNQKAMPTADQFQARRGIFAIGIQNLIEFTEAVLNKSEWPRGKHCQPAGHDDGLLVGLP